jgi:hypothetical protein
VPLLCLAVILAGCGEPGPSASSGGVTLRITQPTQDQVLTVHSLSVQVVVAGLEGFRARYLLDGADQGGGDTSITIGNVAPGRHRVEVEVLRGDGTALTPALRAGVDFTVQ